MKLPIFKIIFIALAALIITASVMCSGYNEGSMNGSCSISLLTPIYNSAMDIVLILAFSAIFWVPVLGLIIYLVVGIRKEYRDKKVIK